MTSINQKRTEVRELSKLIDGGKLKGAKLAKATRRIGRLKRRIARQGDQPVIKGPTKKAIKKAVRLANAMSKKKEKFNPNQGFIPGFLKQMNMVRVEELVAQKIFEAFKSGEVVVQPKLKKAI